MDMNSNYKKKYLKYKNKYVNLKKYIQKGSGLPAFIEHGIGMNIHKFMLIIANKGIFSHNKATEKGLKILKSHVNTTGGNDCISVSIPRSATSITYSVNGITFIINTTGLSACPPKKGQLDGEEYIFNEISLANISAIYISPSIKDLPMNNFNLCTLGYGSASTTDKIKFQFESFENLTAEQIASINKLISDYDNAYNTIRAEYEIRAKALAPQDRTSNNLIQLSQEISSKYYSSLEAECTQMYLALLSIKLNTDVSKMSLENFIQSYLQLTGNNIPLVNELPQ
jgi:hypothetical protein